MAFKPKPTRNKTESLTKSLYIKADLAEKVNELAKKHNTSFNNIIVSIVEEFFKREEKQLSEDDS